MAFLLQPWSWALLLVLLPVLIHWLQIRRSKTLLFPGVHRLKMLTQSGQNPDRVRHRWLLLLRSLALLCLVLAFLGAMHHSDTNAVQRYCIAIDQSGSMRESGLNEKAKLELNRWLSLAPAEAQFCLPQWGSQWLSAQQLRRKIQSLDQQWPYWTWQQFRAYAKTLNDANGLYLYIGDAYSEFQDSLVQCVVYESEEPLKNASIDTMYRVPSDEGPVFKIRIGLQGFGAAESLPELTLNDADGKPLQGLVYSERESEWAEALYSGSLPSNGAWLQLSPSGWSFDDRLYVVAPQKPKLRVMIQGSHPFAQPWVSSSPQFQAADSSFDVAYLSDGLGQSGDWSSWLRAVQQGATAVCLDVRAASKLLDAEFELQGATSGPEALSSTGLDHPLFRDVFREVDQNFNRKMPSFSVLQQPSASSLANWEVLLMTEQARPIYLLRQEGLGRVFLWLGGAQPDFIASPWSVALLGMPALQLAWADGPLYGVLGRASTLPVGAVKPGSSNNPNWSLVGRSDSLVPELRQRAGQWELPLNQRSFAAGLFAIAGPSIDKVIALNEPRLPDLTGTGSGAAAELPPWSGRASEANSWVSLPILFLGLSLLFLSFESVFVFLKERHEP